MARNITCSSKNVNLEISSTLIAGNSLTVPKVRDRENTVYNYDDNLLNFIEILQEIDSTKSITELNKDSIFNNNGGRILL